MPNLVTATIATARLSAWSADGAVDCRVTKFLVPDQTMLRPIRGPPSAMGRLGEPTIERDSYVVVETTSTGKAQFTAVDGIRGIDRGRRPNWSGNVHVTKGTGSERASPSRWTPWGAYRFVGKDGIMTTTEQDETAERTNKLIESVRNAEDSALEAVREFLDTVNGVFPDTNAEDGPRRKIIDSAFKMTEQLVGASTQLAERVITVASSVPKSVRGSSK
jgi:hypothetical protein